MADTGIVRPYALEGSAEGSTAVWRMSLHSLDCLPLGVMRELVRAGGGDVSRLDAAAIVRASGATP